MIEIEKECDISFDFDMNDLITKVILEAADYCNCPYEIAVNVVLTDNAGIHEVNRETRSIDRPTDVLSFPMLEYDHPCDFDGLEEDDSLFDLESGELILGDIMISLEKVISQAEEYGHSPKRELAFLTAHSMMHLFGYDHMTEEEAKVMESKQEEVLKRLHITR